MPGWGTSVTERHPDLDRSVGILPPDGSSDPALSVDGVAPSGSDPGVPAVRRRLRPVSGTSTEIPIVAGTPKRLVSQNLSRTALIIRNPSAVDLHLFLGNTGRGMGTAHFRVAASGGALSLSGEAVFYGEVWGNIASSTATIDVLEY